MVKKCVYIKGGVKGTVMYRVLERVKIGSKVNYDWYRLTEGVKISKYRSRSNSA